MEFVPQGTISAQLFVLRSDSIKAAKNLIGFLNIVLRIYVSVLLRCTV